MSASLLVPVCAVWVCVCEIKSKYQQDLCHLCAAFSELETLLCKPQLDKFWPISTKKVSLSN